MICGVMWPWRALKGSLKSACVTWSLAAALWAIYRQSKDDLLRQRNNKWQWSGRDESMRNHFHLTLRHNIFTTDAAAPPAQPSRPQTGFRKVRWKKTHLLSSLLVCYKVACWLHVLVCLSVWGVKSVIEGIDATQARALDAPLKALEIWGPHKCTVLFKKRVNNSLIKMRRDTARRQRMSNSLMNSGSDGVRAFWTVRLADCGK